MRILYINDQILYGGTEIQHNREINLISKEDIDVYKLYFVKPSNDKEKLHVDDKTYIVTCKSNFINKIYNKFFCDFRKMIEIKKIINNINPDIIRVNNITFMPYTQYRALAGYKVIQTARDYSFICPIRTGVDISGECCNGINNNKCLEKCCKGSIKNLIKYYRLKSIINLRNRYVSKFISPSNTLKMYLDENGYNESVVINDCLEISKKNINNNIDIKNKYNMGRYLFFGAINDEIKGVFTFIKNLNEYSTQIKLFIAGKIEDKKLFEKYVNNNPNIVYLGELTNKQILELLKEIKVVVIPSLCQENYPNTALEAIMNKCIVIGSNRGGIPEIINDKRFTFNPNDIGELFEVLDRVQGISEKEFKKIVDRNYINLIKNNSKENYLNKIKYVLEEEKK